MEQGLTKPYKEVNLAEQLDLFHEIVTHDYLALLNECQIVPLNQSDNTTMRWYKITKIVTEKDVFFGDKLSMLYTSLHDTAKNVVLVLHKENEGISNYIWVPVITQGINSFRVKSSKLVLKAICPA